VRFGGIAPESVLLRHFDERVARIVGPFLEIPLPDLHNNASPELRDRFLNALDLPDRTAAVESAKYLVSCSNYLPSGTCMALGLPPGSRYWEAATRVLASAASNLSPRVDLRSLVHLAKDGY